MKEKLLSIFSVMSALFAIICWSGGAILISLGLGTAGLTYFSGLSKYKPIFVIFTAITLYFAYTTIEKKNSSRKSKILFLICALLCCLILYSPLFL